MKDNRKRGEQTCLVCGGKAIPYLPRILDSYYLCDSCDLVGSVPPDTDEILALQAVISGSSTKENPSDEAIEAYKKLYRSADGISHAYMKHFHEYDAVTRMMRERVTSTRLVGKGTRVIEVGGGDGSLAKALQDLHPACFVQLVEPSPSNCEEASANGVNEVFCGTAQEYYQAAYDGHPFDIAVVFGNLMLHSNPISSLATIQCMLASDGVVLFDVKHKNSMFRRIIEIAYGRLPQRVVAAYAPLVFNGPRFLFSEKSLKQACKAAGLHVTSMEPVPARVAQFQTSRYSLIERMGVQLLSNVDRLAGSGAWLYARCRVAPRNGKAPPEPRTNEESSSWL